MGKSAENIITLCAACAGQATACATLGSAGQDARASQLQAQIGQPGPGIAFGLALDLGIDALGIHQQLVPALRAVPLQGLGNEWPAFVPHRRPRLGEGLLEWQALGVLLSNACHADGLLGFSSGWYYSGHGERQSLRLRIERTAGGASQVWQDEHAMVAVSFGELRELLEPYFDVEVLEHDYQKILPWDGTSGNAIFACVKR